MSGDVSREVGKENSAPAGEDATIVAKQNLMEDNRQLRRIRAEDEDWNLKTVSMLIDICIKNIIKHFEFNSRVLEWMPLKQRQYVLSKLPPSLPLPLTSKLIPDQEYWERCAKNRWPVNDIYKYGNDWKRLYFQKNLESHIESFVPNRSNMALVVELAKLSAPFVAALEIEQLLPPVADSNKPKPEDDEEDDEADETELDHFDFRPVVEVLPELSSLKIRYGMKDCGMNFSWNIFSFTHKDCLGLSKLLKDFTRLTKLSLTESRIEDDKVRVIISYLLDHPGLQNLDLSENRIGDRGGRAIGKLLNGHSTITRLDLTNNLIEARGAHAIAHALTSKTSTLKWLSLRLNRLADEGGQAICKSLLSNRTLETLNLAVNQLSEPTAAVLAHVLCENDVVAHLDLSCNKLGVDSGKQLREGIDANTSLLTVDLRLTEVGSEAEYCIQQRLTRNREESHKRNLKMQKRAEAAAAKNNEGGKGNKTCDNVSGGNVIDQSMRDQ